MTFISRSHGVRLLQMTLIALAVLTVGIVSSSEASAKVPTTSTSSSIATGKISNQCRSYAAIADRLEKVAKLFYCKGIGDSSVRQHQNWCEKQNAFTLRTHEVKRKMAISKCLKSKRSDSVRSCSKYGSYAKKMEISLKTLGCGKNVTTAKAHRKWCTKQKKKVRSNHQSRRTKGLLKCISKQETKLDPPKKKRPTFGKKKKGGKKGPVFGKAKKGDKKGDKQAGGKQPGGKQPGGKKPGCVWNTSDIIEKRIDHRGGQKGEKNAGAQYTLMRKMHGTDSEREKASAIISAVKSGTLAGVMTELGAKPRLTKMKPKGSYWEIVPQGKKAFCWKKPANKAPMIVYIPGYHKSQIDAAILEAWSECGLPTPKDACEYAVDRWKPPEDVPELEKTECRPDVEYPELGDAACMKKYDIKRSKCLAGVCEQCRDHLDCFYISQHEGQPKTNYCVDNKCTYIDKKVPKSRCLPEAAIHCRKGEYCRITDPLGKAIGICTPNNKPVKACAMKAQKEKVTATKKCDAEQLKKVKECVPDMFKEKKLTGMAKKAFCAAWSYKVKKTCRKTATTLYRKAYEKCHNKP